jgi:esterase/lipase superfamily enzyme
MRSLGWRIPAERLVNREVVFATHGFNVSYAAGVHALARLEHDLGLAGRFLFVGVLWPGDYWLPVVNYPSEAADAVRCGRLLARFADATLDGARSISFVSHSLGARLVLEAVKRMRHPAREVCLLAAAVDDDCLATEQYAGACANAQRVTVLASTSDMVLRLAYPGGDFLSDVGGDDDSPWCKALGYEGPHPRGLAHVEHAQIASTARYGHGDYLPPSELNTVNAKTTHVRDFVREVMLGSPHAWPV